MIWDLVSDVTRVGEFSPETFEAEWLGGAGSPEAGRVSAVTCGATAGGRCTGPSAR